jgi:hypothetical protein
VRSLKILLCVSALCVVQAAFAQTKAVPAVVSTNDLENEIHAFLDREIAAHTADIHSLDPPQDRVVGALTTGEFSWGTFMRALAAYTELAGTQTVAGRSAPELIGKIGLIESKRGGISFAQLYAALAIRHFGTDLRHNALWQSLTPQEQTAWRSLLDPGRFYDRAKRQVINLPENYLGVASRVAAISFELGIITDRVYVDDILDRAAQQFTSGALYSDDAPATGRYDRYSQEYARYLVYAAEIVGRPDVLKALEPSLKAQMHLWWDLMSPDGYGYPWGRSLGAISYMDTMEIVAFLGTHAQFRPAPLPQLAAAYYAAWRWLRNDYKDGTHLLSVFDFGRGNYDYINKEREWQQTTACLGKIIGAELAFIPILRQERIESFPAQPTLPDVARFEWFSQRTDRRFGVWVVRRGLLHFALPFTTGPKPGMSDYEPAPHGLPGFAAPVEQIYPCLVPFLELKDGSTIVAGDGADEIRPAQDGSGVTAIWKRWVKIGDKAGTHISPGITTEVDWKIEGNTLLRRETLTSSSEFHIQSWRVTVPSTGNAAFTSENGGHRVDRIEGSATTLEVSITQASFPVTTEIIAAGNGPLGRGSQGHIALHLVYQSKEMILQAGNPATWEIRITVLPGAHPAEIPGRVPSLE